MAKKLFTVIGGVLLLCGLSFGVLAAVAALLSFGGILSAAVCIALPIVAQKLHKYLPPKSVLIAEAITLLLGIGGLALTFYLEKVGYWDGEFFGGLGEMLLAFATMAVALLTLITSVICQCVAHMRGKKMRQDTSSSGEPV